MIALSFDTSLAACSAAVVELGSEAKVLAASYCEPGKGHAEILLSLISEAMVKAGVDFKDIDRQIITVGPGSFTGVRVALSAARGFRVAHGIPICSLSTMQAISTNISTLEMPVTSAAIGVIIDARREEAYGQVFDAAFQPLCAPALVAVDELTQWLEPWADTKMTILGTGVGLIESNSGKTAKNLIKICTHMFPDAGCFAKALGDKQPDQTPPNPLYLRKPDAKPQIIGQAPG